MLFEIKHISLLGAYFLPVEILVHVHIKEHYSTSCRYWP